jgi:CHASE3 domain sensor protein
MLNVLRNDPRSKDAINGDRMKAVKEMKWTNEAGHVVVSADLTAASDLISHDLALALWEGVYDTLTEVEKQILFYCLGP